MQVLHISTSDYLGGSAKSAYKIHIGLRERGFISRMLVRNKITADPDVSVIGRGLPRFLDLIGKYILDPAGAQGVFFPTSFSLARHTWVQSADVIQLYNTHGGYFSHLALRRLGQGRQIVWRLSDMWPLTGHCAYAYDCDRWQTGCGQCPRLDEYPEIKVDTTRLLWWLKQKAYHRCNIHVVATNRWMTANLRQSPLMGQFERSVIPNGIDLNLFKEIERRAARRALGISQDADVVVFCSHVALPGTRKGGEFVIPSMEKLVRRTARETVLLVVGERAEIWPEGNGYDTVRIGYTSSEKLMAIVYSAADLMVSPALAENFPNTILEAAACGTPSVAFNIGGVPDIVKHRETGYLARYKDSGDLARGLAELLYSRDDLLLMSAACRDRILSDCSIDNQTDSFVALYRKLVPHRVDCD